METKLSQQKVDRGGRDLRRGLRELHRRFSTSPEVAVLGRVDAQGSLLETRRGSAPGHENPSTGGWPPTVLAEIADIQDPRVRELAELARVIDADTEDDEWGNPQID